MGRNKKKANNPQGRNESQKYLMTRAVQLWVAGFTWREIAEAINTAKPDAMNKAGTQLLRPALGTIQAWRKLPEWKDLEAEYREGLGGELVERARQVVLKRLEFELKQQKPDIGVAEKVLKNMDSAYIPKPEKPDGTPMTPSLFPQGTVVQVALPKPDTGMESKPAHEVLEDIRPDAIGPGVAPDPGPEG